MRIPQHSIADLMGLAMLAALDCLAFMIMDARDDTAYLASSSVPCRSGMCSPSASSF